MTQRRCVYQVTTPGLTFTITKPGFPDAVVWNPWVDKSCAMADFGDEEYKVRLEGQRLLLHAVADTYHARQICSAAVHAKQQPLLLSAIAGMWHALHGWPLAMG
jgi:hypothetical protein